MPQFMTENNTITLEPGVVSLAQLRDFYINHCPFKLYPDAWNDINKSAAAVQNIVDKLDSNFLFSFTLNLQCLPIGET